VNALLSNLLLALAWTGITATFTPANFTLGFVIGFAAMWVTQRVPGLPRYPRRTWSILSLAIYALLEVFRANIRIAREIIIADQIRPAILSVPIRVRTDSEVTVLAWLVALTPGTTPVDISPDGEHMLIHFTNLPVGGSEAARLSIIEGFEQRVLRAMR